MPRKSQKRKKFSLVLVKATRPVRLPARGKRRISRAAKVAPVVTAAPIVRTLKKITGAAKFLAKNPRYAVAANYGLIATFTPCGKTGTARYLDIWDADHFDGVTDLASNLRDCRIWFSANGYTFWGSGETKTGRVNCYFRAPSAGNYLCNVELTSDGGSAMVECFIDSMSYGPLPVSGSINWPHPCTLSQGYHHFRIRQMTGAFFFHRLTVWGV